MIYLLLISTDTHFSCVERIVKLCKLNQFNPYINKNPSLPFLNPVALLMHFTELLQVFTVPEKPSTGATSKGLSGAKDTFSLLSCYSLAQCALRSPSLKVSRRIGKVNLHYREDRQKVKPCRTVIEWSSSLLLWGPILVPLPRLPQPKLSTAVASSNIPFPSSY